MIEGLKIEITGVDLSALLKKRGEYHKTKAELYAKQGKEFEALNEEIERGTSKASTSNTAAQQIASTSKSHKQKANFFFFLADHVAINETYRLDNEDLRIMELSTSF